MELILVFFLIKNDFKELSNDFIIYANGKSKIKYAAWAHYNSDYYSIDLDNYSNDYEIIESKTFLRIQDWKNAPFIIVRIDSSTFDNITVLTNFHNNIISSPSINLYSHQLFCLNNNISLFFNFRLYHQFKILINNFIGKTEICLNENCKDNNKIVFSGKKTLSFLVTNIIKNISFNVLEELVLSIKLDYQIENNMINEFYFDNDIQDNVRFPIGYYLKEVEYEGADINFYFNFDKSITNNYNLNGIIITGYIVDIEYIKYLNSIKVIGHPLDKTRYSGTFDLRTNIGLIAFDKESVQNKTKDQYYYIIINYQSLTNYFSLEVNAHPKNSPSSLIPINKYISGFFDILINKTIYSQRYYIHDEKNENIT